MKVSTYLTFNDDCLEAFEFYRSIFGGEFTTLMTFREGPEEMGIAEADLDRIMHVSLPIGSSVLMGSDTCESFGPPRVKGNNFSLCFEANSTSHADEVFEKMSIGGKVIMPMDDAFWGSYYGKCIDKFGISWDILADLSQA